MTSGPRLFKVSPMATINDIVLVYFEKEPLFYARIEDINPDVKPGWYSVRIQALTMPTQDISWILREEYIDGAEFTMGGKAMRLEKLEPLVPGQAPVENSAPGEKKRPARSGKKPASGKVVSLFDRSK